MNNSKNLKDEFEQIAEEGWKQMHQKLIECGLTTENSYNNRICKRRSLGYLFSGLFIFILFLTPLMVTNNITVTEKTISQNNSFKKHSYINSIPSNPSRNLRSFSKFSRIDPPSVSRFKGPNGMPNLETVKYIKAVFESQHVLTGSHLSSDHYAHCCDVATKLQKSKRFIIERKKSLQSFNQNILLSKKVQLFVGAFVKIPVESEFPHTISFNHLNISPLFTALIPLNRKLNLSTGLALFSSISGNQITTKQKEFTSSVNSTFTYNIYTASVTNVYYIDLPVMIDYSINKKWFFGSGIQFSKLYKVKIRNEKDTYDSSNTLSTASVSQYNASPTAAKAALYNKIEIRKIDPRITAEVHLNEGRFLISAEYCRSIFKSIQVEDPYNSIKHFRVQYFSLGLQYLVQFKK